jgi:hypothetical protein
MAFSFDEMLNFATEAWGYRGTAAVRMWATYNDRYFGGVLRPIPLVMTNAQPFGRRLAFCSHGGRRTITLNVPEVFDNLLADNATLLHEMIHQHLFERGEDSKHAGEPWRREIMRLHHEITGETIWAGPSKTVRRSNGVIRINAPANDGRPSLPQKAIARWPHDLKGIQLGYLGKQDITAS